MPLRIEKYDQENQIDDPTASEAIEILATTHQPPAHTDPYAEKDFRYDLGHPHLLKRYIDEQSPHSHP